MKTETETRIETDDFRTAIEPGKYTCETDCTVFLCHGKGDGRRDISYANHKAGSVIDVPSAVNGHWYGLEPNGDMFAPKPAVLVEC